MDGQSVESGRTRKRRSRTPAEYRYWWQSLVGVFALAVLIFLPTLSDHPVLQDAAIVDGSTFGSNPFAALTHLAMGVYRPITALSLILDHSLYGSSVSGYHFTNLILHGLTAVLVALLGAALFKKRLGGVVAGALFAVQPAHMGSMALLGARAELLSCLLVAAFLYTLILFRQTEQNRWLYLSIALIVLAILAKETNVLFAFLAPLVYKIGGRKRLSWKKTFPRTVPIGIAAVLAIGIWVLMGGPSALKTTVPVSELLIRAAASSLNYLLVLLGIQRDSLFTFSVGDYRQQDLIFVGACVFLASLGAAILSLRKVQDWSILVCGFFLTLVTVSGFIPTQGFVVEPDRAALCGLFAALLIGWVAIRTHWALPAVVAGIWGFSTLTMSPIWSSDSTLFDVVTDVDPGCLPISIQYSKMQLAIGKFEDVIDTTGGSLAWVYDQDDWQVKLTEPQPKFERVRLTENTDEPGGRLVASLLILRARAAEHTKESAEIPKLLGAAKMIDPQNPEFGP